MLLMIEGQPRAAQPLQRVPVPAGSARSVVVLQGQLLEIACVDSGAVAALFGFVRDDPQIYLSVHHTRVFSNSYVLNRGMRLVSNRRRPLMVLGLDSVGTHDLLMPASSSADLRAQGRPDALGCVEAVRAEIDRLGIALPRFPDPINLFMNVKVHTDGRLEPLPCRSKPGDRAVFRVVRDMVFVVSSCGTGIPHNPGLGALELRVAEDLSEL